MESRFGGRLRSAEHRNLRDRTRRASDRPVDEANTRPVGRDRGIDTEPSILVITSDRVPDDESERRTREHVAQIVLRLVQSRTRHIAGKKIRGDPGAQTVAPVEHGRGRERTRGVSGGERRAVRVIGPFAAHRFLEPDGMRVLDWKLTRSWSGSANPGRVSLGSICH